MIHDFNPVLVDLGYLQIRWYSLAYIFGILAGWKYGKFIIKKQILNIDQNIFLKNFDDLIGYITIGVIAGGRIGYVIFYDPVFYLNNLGEIFKLWKGGMSFHGGFIGVIIAIYFFSKLKKLNYKIYFDTVCCVAPIGIFLGRIANFINGELYGIPTNKSWGIIFPNIDSLPRHPSQIYEAFLEGLILFIILNFLLRKKILGKGIISSLFLILYGVFRIISEQFREPDSHIGYLFNQLSMGTTLSIIMVLLGSFFLSKIIFYEKNK
tara:strand:- start:14565 stop:15359 length:795 start_codon:yes stop_codon:yes gene_type:complete